MTVNICYELIKDNQEYNSEGLSVSILRTAEISNRDDS